MSLGELHHSGPGNLLQFQERFYPQDLLHDEAEELLGIWKGREKQGVTPQTLTSSQDQEQEIQREVQETKKKFRKIQETKQ